VRRDLTAVEEANGIQTMLNVGWKEPGTAIGRSKERVAQSVKVAAMSDALKEVAVQATLDEAVTLAEFADDPKAVKALTKALENGHAGFAWAAADLRRKRDNKAAIDAATADLKARGIRVVKRDYMGGQRELTYLKDKDSVPFTAESHASCPGHAATVCTDYTGIAAVTYVCTDAVAQHSTNQVDAKAEAKRAKAEAEKARIESEWATASEVRIAFVRKMLRGKVPSGVMPWAFSVLCTTGDGYMYASAPRFEAVWGGKPGVATEKYAPGMIAALAAAHVESELDSITRYTYVRSAAAKKLYLELLLTEGYALSPVERTHYDDCVKELTAKPAEDEDDDCDQDCDACTHQCEEAS
jgi:ParB family chromosome partitioning protein